MRDREVKQHLLISGDRSLKEALTLQAAKASAGPPARLRSDYSHHGNEVATR
jgi:hypothetical protein